MSSLKAYRDWKRKIREHLRDNGWDQTFQTFVNMENWFESCWLAAERAYEASLVPLTVATPAKVSTDISSYTDKEIDSLPKTVAQGPSVFASGAVKYPKQGVEEKGPYYCFICKNSGYMIQPGGLGMAFQCPRGCQPRCPICNDPNCHSPGGKH